MLPSDDYIEVGLQRGFDVCLEVDRTFEIEKERRGRCLSPIGESLFEDAVHGYLAGRRDEGDELVAKSRAFLELAHSVGEKRKHNYTLHFSESRRSSALSFVHWLSTGEVNRALLADARTHLDAYYRGCRTLDQGSAALDVPVLLYTEAYAVIRNIAERLSVGVEPNRRRAVTGRFAHAFRIASAANDEKRKVEQELLRKKFNKQLFNFIDRGHFGDLAFILYALYPRPVGPPNLLIKECWKYIPEEIISKRLAEMRSLGLVADK